VVKEKTGGMIRQCNQLKNFKTASNNCYQLIVVKGNKIIEQL